MSYRDYIIIITATYLLSFFFLLGVTFLYCEEIKELKQENKQLMEMVLMDTEYVETKMINGRIRAK